MSNISYIKKIRSDMELHKRDKPMLGELLASVERAISEDADVELQVLKADLQAAINRPDDMQPLYHQ